MAICEKGISRIRVKAPNGKESILFKDMLSYFKGDRDKAISLYAITHTPEFRNTYGDFLIAPESINKLDSNNQPKLQDVIDTISKEQTLFSPKRISKDMEFTFSPNFKKDYKAQTEDEIKNNKRRSRQLIAKRKAIMDDLYKQLNKLKFIDKYDARREEYKINQKIAILSSEIHSIEEETDAEALGYFGEKDLKRAAFIINNNNATINDFFYARNLLNIWKDAQRTFFPESPASAKVAYGDQNAATTSKSFKGLASISAEARRLSDIADRKEVHILNEYLSGETGREIDIKKEFREQEDYTIVHANTMDISRTDNVMFQIVSNTNYKMIGRAKEEFREFEEEFDQILDRTEKELKRIHDGKGSIYDIFRETYKDGKETGNMITQFTPEYIDEQAIQFSKAIESNSETSWARFYSWFNDNNHIFDFRILFYDAIDDTGATIWTNTKYTETDREALKKELKEYLGDLEFNRMMELSEKYLDDYKMAREVANDEIFDRADITHEQKEELFDKWEMVNSPFYYADAVANQKIYMIDKSIVNHKGRNYTLAVPRKYKKGTNELTGWFNEDFSKIKDNETLYNFYQKAIKTIHNLNYLLPYHEVKGMRDNSIPNLKKGFIDRMHEDGFKGIYKDLYTSMIESLTTNDSNQLVFADIDPYTGELEKNLTIKFVKDNIREINKRYTSRIIEFELENGKASIEDKRKIKKEIVDILAKEKSFDLGRVIKAYYMSVMFYVAKSKIEDLVRISDSVFQKEAETLKTPSGKIKRHGRIGNAMTKKEGKSFKNIKDQWDYWVEYFYGHRSDDEKIFKRKLLTAEEKDEKAKVERLLTILKDEFQKGNIDAEEYNIKVTKLENTLEQLGGNYSFGKIGRVILKYNQLKSMGWNAFSGVTNMAHGYMNNFMEANDGRVFTKKDLAIGYKKVFNSVLKNWTFNAFETLEAKKIRALIDRFDVLSETSNELYQRSYRSKKGAFAWMNPYNIQNRTEYFNQAPVMVAILLNKKNTVKDLKGNEHPIYEAFDENGKWKTEIFGKEDRINIDKIKLKIATEIARIHGNYNSEKPVRANKKFITTAMKQFRMWMMEGIADRFEREHHNEALNIDLKGRYKTGAFIFTWAKPKPELMASLNSSKRTAEDEVQADGYQMGIKDILYNNVFVIKQLLRKLTFQNTKFEERFTEVDAANLRKNLSETVILGEIAGFILLLSMMGGDDDDDKFRFAIKNYTLNLLFRAQDDVKLYISPNSFQQVLQEPVPIMRIVTDLSKLIDASFDLARGEDEITRGIYTGESKFKRAAFRNLPFVSKIQSNISAMSQVYNDIQYAK